MIIAGKDSVFLIADLFSDLTIPQLIGSFFWDTFELARHPLAPFIMFLTTPTTHQRALFVALQLLQLGSPVATSCDAGTEWNADTSSCLDCLPGFYLEANSAEKPCDSCPKGKYNNQNRQATCKDCLAGFYNDQTERTTIGDCEYSI